MSAEKSRHIKPIPKERLDDNNTIEEVNTEDAVQIIETVNSIDPTLLRGLSGEKKQKLIRSIAVGVSITKTHSGPLPAPETLDAYNRIIDNGAERIMRMAEKEQESRHSQSSYIATRMLNQSATGQIFGFIICFIAISGGIYLSANGNDTAGIATIVTALVSLVGAFLYTKMKEKN